MKEGDGQAAGSTTSLYPAKGGSGSVRAPCLLFLVGLVAVFHSRFAKISGKSHDVAWLARLVCSRANRA